MIINLSKDKIGSVYRAPQTLHPFIRLVVKSPVNEKEQYHVAMKCAKGHTKQTGNAGH